MLIAVNYIISSFPEKDFTESSGLGREFEILLLQPPRDPVSWVCSACHAGTGFWAWTGGHWVGAVGWARGVTWHDVTWPDMMWRLLCPLRAWEGRGSPFLPETRRCRLLVPKSRV